MSSIRNLHNLNNRKRIEHVSENDISETEVAFEIGRRIVKYCLSSQRIVGVSSGWMVGLLTMKIGRVALLAAGGALLLIQLGYDANYININWDKIYENEQRVNDSNEMDTGASESVVPLICKLIIFFKTNVPFSVSFLGGFLIGLATK
ncbi:FUN14 domain-containing protein 1B-like [Cylas formicarius]|uniref:FUN14 domain-containing protein 1B-like n=1 Tax=Cylas formicarius TaxID=197179 RepID=UPI002958BBB4|nr:FUN14 domain-containing protein 1B-like [Cylas formicarius]